MHGEVGGLLFGRLKVGLRGAELGLGLAQIRLGRAQSGLGVAQVSLARAHICLGLARLGAGRLSGLESFLRGLIGGSLVGLGAFLERRGVGDRIESFRRRCCAVRSRLKPRPSSRGRSAACPCSQARPAHPAPVRLAGCRPPPGQAASSAGEGSRARSRTGSCPCGRRPRARPSSSFSKAAARMSRGAGCSRARPG